MNALVIPPTLHHATVSLRSWQSSDAALIHKLVGEADRIWWTYGDRWELAEVESVIERHRTWPERGDGFSLAIVPAGASEPVGFLAVLRVDLRHENAELAYWIAPAYRGKGLTKAAVQLLSRWCLSEGGFKRLAIHTAPDNVASQRVALQTGFVHEGVQRSCYNNRRNGQREDSVVFSLLPSDLVERG